MHTTLPARARSTATLALATAAALTALPSAAFGGLTIDWTTQEQGYSIFSTSFGDVRNTGSGTVGWTNHSGQHSFSLSADGDPFTIDMGFATFLEAQETGRGRVTSNISVDGGYSNSNYGLTGYARTYFSSRFHSDEPATILLSGFANVSGSSGGLPTYVYISRQSDSETMFDWSHRGFPNTYGALDTSITLPAGAYELRIESGVFVSQPSGSSGDPTLVDMDMSFAIIPAPATLLPLATLPFLAAARRRRPSGR